MQRMLGFDLQANQTQRLGSQWWHQPNTADHCLLGHHHRFGQPPYVQVYKYKIQKMETPSLCIFFRGKLQVSLKKIGFGLFSLQASRNN